MIERISNQIIDLDAFDRRQQVQRVYVMENGAYVLRDNAWTMDWSLEHKREVAAGLKSADCIAYAAWEDGRIIAFVSVLKQLRGRWMVLDIIQVDRAFRGRGVGRQMWNLAVREAQRAGAAGLYISACCSEETVGFYRAMGAEATDDPIREFAEAEPCDIQMVCPIR